MPPKDDPLDLLPLHPLEFQILLSLLRGPANAYAIVTSIEERQVDGITIQPTNLYRRIWRLEGAGLVSLDLPRTEADGRRKYFRITRDGRRVAEAETRRLRALLDEARLAGIVEAQRGTAR